MKSKKLKLSNIYGDVEADSIRESVYKMNGVKSISVDSLSNTITVNYDENSVSLKEIKSKIETINNSFS